MTDSLLPEETFDAFWAVSSSGHGGRPGGRGWASGGHGHHVQSENSVRTHMWDHGVGRGPLTTDTKPGPPVTACSETSTLTALGLGRDGLVPCLCPAPQPHGDPSQTERTARSPGLPTPGIRSPGSHWEGHPDLQRQGPRASDQDPPWAAPASQVPAAGQPPAGSRSPSSRPARHSTTARHSCCFQRL